MLVIGGSRGIGAAVVRKAAEAGYAVVFSYASREDAAKQIVAETSDFGTPAKAIKADTRNAGELAALFDTAANNGPLTAMVFCAGITGAASPLAEANAETIRDVIEVNLVGAMLAGREAVRRMALSHGGAGGSITFLSSRASAYGSANEYAWYAASKGGLDSFMIGLGKEVAEDGIRVNCVSPGPIATDMISPERQQQGAARVPMRRVGQPEEVADAVLYLASDAASYITGANLPVSGGA